MKRRVGRAAVAPSRQVTGGLTGPQDSFWHRNSLLRRADSIDYKT